MKKKLLFVIPSLSIGGGEKSLANLLAQLNYEEYEVDLLLFKKEGEFVKSLPKSINVLEPIGDYNIFAHSLLNSICSLIIKRNFNLAFSRLMFTIVNRLLRRSSFAEQVSWRFYKNAFSFLDKEYHSAIGYLEKSSIYYVVDKVKSKKKIGWIHTNYSNSGMNPSMDLPYFNVLDHMVTVSEECAISLEQNFPNLKDKIKVIYNIVSPSVICKLSNENINNSSFKTNTINIVTLARLSYEKGIDIAIKACEILVKKGYRITWSVLGEGRDRLKLEEQIKHKHLENNIRLLGNQSNPYPFIREADIYIQPSRYEGKSIALDEAKILQKPIIVTNYKTAKDQILNGVNGIISEMNGESLAAAIEKLILEPDLREYLISNLYTEPLDTENEIQKVYEIL